MTKILFMLINMNVGGTEKALLSLLEALPKSSFDITLLMLDDRGGFMDAIPDHVRVEILEGYEDVRVAVNSPPIPLALNFIKKGNWVRGLQMLASHLKSKLVGHRSGYFKHVLRVYPVRNERYDLAVAFAGPMDFISYYVAHKINAEKKAQWVHFDLSKISFNPVFAKKTYSYFDKVFSVSDDVNGQLKELLPKLQHKIETFHNITSKKAITEMAETGEGFDDDFKGVRKLTVGRLTLEKGQDLTIPVLARLREEGYDVRWYCIGEGASRSRYSKLIKKYRVEDYFIILGSKLNPYPYMKQCDIYVQPSRHEGYGITIDEAMCFDSPIVTTNFLGVERRIKNEETGLIVCANEAEIYRAVKRLLDDKNLSQSIRPNLMGTSVDNVNEVMKLSALLA